jgi:hypothetical protein
MVHTSRNTGTPKKRKSVSSSPGGVIVDAAEDANEVIVTDMALSPTHVEEDRISNNMHSSIENTPKNFMSNLQAMVCFCVCVPHI